MKKIGGAFFAILMVKLGLSFLMPLQADEAYYWIWSHHLQLSYYDHPAMIAWILSLGHFLEPYGQAFRWPGVLLSMGTLYAGYKIIEMRFLDLRLRHNVQLTWLCLTSLSLFLGFGSLIQTPDLPVLFFWTWSLYFTLRIVQKQQVVDYALLGLTLGLGFCSKYHIVLFIPSLLIYLSWDRQWSRINWSGVIVTTVLGLVGCLPVLIFNYQDEWKSFLFQLQHGLGGQGFSYRWPLDYLLGQFLLLNPWIVYLIYRFRNQLAAYRFEFVFAAFPLLFFFYSSFKASGEANWPIIAYPSALLLASYFWIQFSQVHKLSAKSWLKGYASFSMLIYFILFVAFAVPAVRKSIPKISEFDETKEWSLRTQQLRPLFVQNFQLASLMTYHLKEPIYKLKGQDRFDFFDTLPESEAKADFYLIKSKNYGLPEAYPGNVRIIEKLNDDYELVFVERK